MHIPKYGTEFLSQVRAACPLHQVQNSPPSLPTWRSGGCTAEDSLFLFCSPREEGGGPPMMVKDSLFLLISNVLGRGPNNDDEGISVSADFKCFKKEVWG